MDLMLLKVPFVMHIVSVLWVLCAVTLILIILIQKGRGGGLSGAFGGGMAGGILGTKTGDFLTWVTVGLVGALLLLTIVMAKFYRPTTAEEPTAQTQPLGQPAPTESEAQPAEQPPAQPGIPLEQPDTEQPADEQDMPDTTPDGTGTNQNQD